jgi:hypothetical protein
VVQDGQWGLEGCALRRSGIAKEVSDIAVAGWAGFGLTQGHLEDRSDMAYPMFQTEGGILQAFGQGNVVVHSSAVVVKDKIRQAVDVAGAGKKKLVGIGCGVRGRVVEMMVPCIPLGARHCLELVCPEAYEMSRLVPIPRVTTVSKVFILKCQPGLVKEAVEERGSP